MMIRGSQKRRACKYATQHATPRARRLLRTVEPSTKVGRKRQGIVFSHKASEACELARALATTQHHRTGYRTHCLTREEPDNPLHERVLFGIVNKPLGLVCVVGLFVFVCAHLSQLAMPGV